jgi:hypothetical protein
VETVTLDSRVGVIVIESVLFDTMTMIARNAADTTGATDVVYLDLGPDPRLARSIAMTVTLLESTVLEATVDAKLIGMTTEERGGTLIVNVERRRHLQSLSIFFDLDHLLRIFITYQIMHSDGVYLSIGMPVAYQCMFKSIFPCSFRKCR